MLVLADASIVLADRILSPGTLVIDAGTIIDVRPGTLSGHAGAERRELTGHYVVPGFIDVHVHGVEGHDTLDGADGLQAMSARLPAYGVTAFCPTTVACGPRALATMLDAVRTLRTSPAGPPGARVLPAHLESNFINPDCRGAQPLSCLRLPPDPVGPAAGAVRAGATTDQAFDANDILAEIERRRPDVGIVTLAPELPHALSLIERLVRDGHRVSLGHSAATYDEALAAIAAGARRATHLFNRMPPLGHRCPGLAGAVLTAEDVAVEIVCDGHHVHPAVVRMAVAAKGPSRTMAVTDGTAGSGLPEGSQATLGGQRITVKDAVYLDDGTMAGSAGTMDRAFRTLVGAVGLTLVEAAILCATTPAREMGLIGLGAIAAGATADLTVLDSQLNVAETLVAGRTVYARPQPDGR
jgi:N-acetylglucosamine-6-phosphate deacetylase